ncbi:hypothetical protein CRI94_13235 [Longibacter salinarum]|uniref:Secretion system C-terminal sorting domain-containing protein n=1 Tax=Longibacter salinarum TaxID=1850348 RepID=A0A2A8CWD2_9BACT|nr:T9SS type A sorting domain-containing protein [Longibacter salinarum]PEN12956.1 hypothetical protein CRI94_13235 [Longibacter salinarum]
MSQRYILFLLSFGLVLFSFGVGNVVAQDGPGGVGNDDGSAGQPINSLWLEADRDAFTNGGCSTVASAGDEVRCWASQSDYTEGGGQTTADVPGGLGAPTLDATVSGFNNRPGLRFDRSDDDALRLENLAPFSSGQFDSQQFYLVFRTGNDVMSRQVLYDQGSTSSGLNLYIEGGELIAGAWGDSGSRALQATYGVTTNSVYVVSVEFSRIVRFSGLFTELQLYVNRTASARDQDEVRDLGSIAAGNNEVGLGNVAGGTQFAGSNYTGPGGNGFEGWIGDFAHFQNDLSLFRQNALSLIRHRIVMTSLAAKYGLSLDDVQLYDFSDYSTRVAGVGREPGRFFGIPVTHELAGSEGLTLDATTNATGALFVGHNGGAPSIISETDVPSVEGRLERVWRLQDASARPQTDLVFDVSGIALDSDQVFRLLQETDAGDGTFQSGTSRLVGGAYDPVEETYTIDAAQVNGSIPDDSYFTLAVAEVALTYDDPSQTATTGETLTLSVDRPESDNIPGANYSYSVGRVSAFGTIQSDLSGTGLSLSANGTLSGVLPQDGTVSVEIIVDAQAGAGGQARTVVKASSIGVDGPGGIGDDATTLLRLDALSLIDLQDDDPVSAWTDGRTYGNDATQSTGNRQPTYAQYDGPISGLPAVEFVDDRLDISNSTSINTGDVDLQRSQTFVVEPDNVSDRQVIYEEGGGARGISLVIDNGDLVATAWNRPNDALVDGGDDATTPWEAASGGDGIVYVTTPIATGQTYVATIAIDFVDAQLDLIVNGSVVGSAPGVGRLYAHGGGIGLGASPDNYRARSSVHSTDDFFEGRIGDVVFSDVNLNEAQRRILHNALGAQYSANIASADDRYDGEATGHNIGVLGVGRETATAQHTSAQRDGLQLVSTGGLDDGDYLLLGHDTRQNGVSTADAVTGGAVVARMLRSYYVSRTEPSTSDLTTDVTFNLQESDVNAMPGDPSGYRLIHRPAGSAPGTQWTVDGTSATVTGADVSFAAVSLIDGREYTLATTNRVISPINEPAIVINGTAGTASTGRIGPDRGYRFIGSLVENATASSLTFADNSYFLQFPAPQGTIFYTWNEMIDDPTQSGTQEGWWEAASPSTPLPPGRGALLYVLDDPTYAVDPSLSIHFLDALDPVSIDDDIVVDNLNLGSEFHFLANSYPVPYDLDGLNTNADGDNDGIADFKAVVQVFDATATSGVNEPTDNAVGFYVTKTSDVAQPQPDREVAPGQGFFVERNDVNGSGRSDALTFDQAFTRNRLVEAPGFVGSLSRTDDARPRARKITLELAVRDDDGTLKSMDRAASVYFRDGATLEEDQFDASKLTPMTGRYALLGIEGPDRSGKTKMWAQRSWPIPESSIEVPMQLHTSDVSGTASIRVHDWYRVPDDWSAVLVDTRGTADPTDDVEHTMEQGDDSAYTFSIDASATSKTTSAKDREPQASPPRFSRLAPHKVPNSAKSGSSASPRFVLRVYPSSDPLPVELANFSVKPDQANVVVEWTTASEVDNDGFGIEYRRVSRSDSTSKRGWAEAGYVKGNGTTDQQNSYRFELKDLDYGRHEVRLRQVDTGGQTAYSEARSVVVRLQEVAAIGKPYPNPVRSRASIDVTVHEKQPVRIELYDLLGRRVSVLHDRPIPANRTETISLATDGLASGQYFLRIRGEAFMETRRVTIVR